jgi:tetratricopeptide (TPR) repeat protein
MRSDAHDNGGPRLLAWLRRWPPSLGTRAGWLGVGVVAVVALLLVLRQPIADLLWPEARNQELRDAAALALKHGRLTSADGSGARELYEAALALDPDRNEARIGLQQVALAALAQARKATDEGRFEDAHRALRLARELSIPRGVADVVAEQLRQREAAVAGIDGMLARAAAARHAGRLDDGVDAALPLYQRVLALQPERTEALEGREDALSDLLQRATAMIARGEIAQAAATITKAKDYDAGHIGLPDAQAALARAVDARRDAAAGALRRGRLREATMDYRDVLAAVPDDTQAQAGLDAVARAQARRAERFAADFRFDQAARALRAAQDLAPQSPEIARAARRLEQARQSRARLPAVPRDTAARMRRVRALLAAAATAEARGDLLTPPGDSAFDHLRTARALAPRNAEVRRASQRLLPAARDCFDAELRGNRLARAQACLDVRTQLGESPATLRSARTRLAQRWLAVGEERLRAGEITAARRAETAARGLDAGVDGLDDFAARLRTAASGRD